jgi:hypothetical protein
MLYFIIKHVILENYIKFVQAKENVLVDFFFFLIVEKEEE